MKMCRSRGYKLAYALVRRKPLKNLGVDGANQIDIERVKTTGHNVGFDAQPILGEREDLLPSWH